MNQSELTVFLKSVNSDLFLDVPKQRAPRVRGEGPKDSGEKKEWTVVGKSANAVKSAPTGRGRGRPPRTVAEQMGNCLGF